MQRQKNSFISSSRRRLHASFVAFIFTLGLAVALGQILAGSMGVIKKNEWIKSKPLEPEDWYLAYHRFHIDHYVLYHGIGDSIQHMRDADVLLLGNSKMQFAFPHAMVQNAGSRTGLKFYNLAFGHAETSDFALQLIRKHDLRPQFVVANADVAKVDAFFRPQASKFGRRVIASNSWEAWKEIFEWSMAGHTRHSIILEWLPDWRNLSSSYTPDWMTIYRSVSSGSWMAYRERPVSRLLGDSPKGFDSAESAIDADILSIAAAFKEELDNRGIQLIMTWVPAPDSWPDRDRACALADALGVPFISPVLDGLVIRDDQHLDDRSAERFASAFLDEFSIIGTDTY